MSVVETVDGFVFVLKPKGYLFLWLPKAGIAVSSEIDQVRAWCKEKCADFRLAPKRGINRSYLVLLILFLVGAGLYEVGHYGEYDAYHAYVPPAQVKAAFASQPAINSPIIRVGTYDKGYKSILLDGPLALGNSNFYRPNDIWYFDFLKEGDRVEYVKIPNPPYAYARIVSMQGIDDSKFIGN